MTVVGSGDGIAVSERLEQFTNAMSLEQSQGVGHDGIKTSVALEPIGTGNRHKCYNLDIQY